MPLEQFLTGSSLPWLRPEDQNGAEITRGANLASSFMENSMRQQEMQQKAQMNPIAVRVAQQDEKLKGLQIAHGLFMQQELINHKSTEAELAAGAQDLRDQGKAGDPNAWMDLGAKISRRHPGVWNDTTFKSGFEEAMQNQKILNNFKVGEERVGVLGKRAATAEEAVQNLKTAKEAADARLREKEATWKQAQDDKISLQKELMSAKNPSGLKAGDTAPILNPITGEPEKGIYQFWNGHQMLQVRQHSGAMSDYQRNETIVALEKMRKSYEENKSTMSPEAEAASRTHIRQMENSLKSADQSSPAPSSQQPQGKVKVSKDGKEWLLPAGQLQEAIKQGYKKAE